jgi:hypothetical protein
VSSILLKLLIPSHHSVGNRIDLPFVLELGQGLVQLLGLIETSIGSSWTHGFLIALAGSYSKFVWPGAGFR